jgi:hypothetical protein
MAKKGLGTTKLSSKKVEKIGGGYVFVVTITKN